MPRGGLGSLASCTHARTTAARVYISLFGAAVAAAPDTALATSASSHSSGLRCGSRLQPLFSSPSQNTMNQFGRRAKQFLATWLTRKRDCACHKGGVCERARVSACVRGGHGTHSRVHLQCAQRPEFLDSLGDMPAELVVVKEPAHAPVRRAR